MVFGLGVSFTATFQRSNHTENKRITPTVTSPRLPREAGQRIQACVYLIARHSLGLWCDHVCVLSLMSHDSWLVMCGAADRMPSPCPREL